MCMTSVTQVSPGAPEQALLLQSQGQDSYTISTKLCKTSAESEHHISTLAGSRPSIGHNPGNMQHSISMATIPLFAGMGTFGPNGPIPHGPAPGQPNAAGGPAAGAAANSPAPQATGADPQSCFDLLIPLQSNLHQCKWGESSCYRCLIRHHTLWPLTYVRWQGACSSHLGLSLEKVSPN